MTELLNPPNVTGHAVVDTATRRDVAALRQLYFSVYGHSYPLPIGTDPEAMLQALEDPCTTWRVIRHLKTGEVIGSVVLSSDPLARIGKVEGVAVHPEHAGKGLAGALLSGLCEQALGPGGALDSVYATARCLSPAPQRVLLREGFRPLGLLPGKMKLHGRESLALMVRYRDGVLARRAVPDEVAEPVIPLLHAARQGGGINYGDLRAASVAPRGYRQRAAGGVEVVQAAGFVQRRYRQSRGGDADLLPLGSPNALVTPMDGRFEAYGAIDRGADCGVLVDVDPSPEDMGEMLGDVVQAMADHGASYVETFVPLTDRDRLALFLAHGFLPSALYPAMRWDGTAWHDYVLLSHTAGRPDFRQLAVDAQLLPYCSHYSQAWTSTYLSTLMEDAQR